MGEHFKEESVVAFLEYIYASVRDKRTNDLISGSNGSDCYIYKRSFDEDKLTIDLLDMGHMYQVEDLQLDCAEYLRAKICDHNVMEVWMTAERCKSKSLSSTAIKHIINRPRGKQIMEVPGLTEAFESHTHLKDLLIDCRRSVKLWKKKTWT